jgi:4-azaleucine resistance transporter AzlC
VPDQPDAARRTVADVRRTAIGVAVATAAYGVSFGALATSNGFDVWQACAMSLLMFTGASQFALVGILGSGGSVASGVATAWLLGARNAFYGLRLASLLRLFGWRRVGGAHLVIDESTAQAVAHDDPELGRAGFWYGGGILFVLWNLTTLIGALAGAQLGDPKAYGLDAASSAAFLALLWPRLHGTTPRVVAVAAAALAVGVVPLVPAGVPVMVAGLAAVLAGLFRWHE